MGKNVCMEKEKSKNKKLLLRNVFKGWFEKS